MHAIQEEARGRLSGTRRCLEHLVYRRAGEVDYVNVGEDGHHLSSLPSDDQKAQARCGADSRQTARKVETLPRSPPPRPRPRPAPSFLGRACPLNASTPFRHLGLAVQCGTMRYNSAWSTKQGKRFKKPLPRPPGSRCRCSYKYINRLLGAPWRPSKRERP